MTESQIQNERTSNNFDFIRLFAASLVVGHHAFALIKQPDFFEQATNNTISVILAFTFFSSSAAI